MLLSRSGGSAGEALGGVRCGYGHVMRTATALPLIPLLLLAAAPATAATAAPGHAGAPPCAPEDLVVEAHELPPIAQAVVLVHVTNTSDAACTVDRFPTVTFGDLDGSARPEPPASSVPYAINAHGDIYAAVRTDDGSGNTRYVPTLTVSADPAHPGTTFTAAEIGAPTPGIPVYDPITTWWFGTPDDAIAALPPR
ncbi:hypothetical protein GCM10023205_35630 [Yinghuangia aomiensis]|uniref:DUF4232 domain-containing protein n=2 Tax=Yinghuangia aomiensis TaxID=676205 RepID=A0ABP9HCT0_9ACTN